MSEALAVLGVLCSLPFVWAVLRLYLSLIEMPKAKEEGR